jgi:hypothetical protein
MDMSVKQPLMASTWFTWIDNSPTEMNIASKQCLHSGRTTEQSSWRFLPSLKQLTYVQDRRRSTILLYSPDTLSLETADLGSVREYFPDLHTTQLLPIPLCNSLLGCTLVLSLCSMWNKNKSVGLFLWHKEIVWGSFPRHITLEDIAGARNKHLLNVYSSYF